MAALHRFCKYGENQTMDIQTCELGVLEKARAAFLAERLKQLQQAVAQAAAEAGSAEGTLPKLEQALREAEQLAKTTRETTAEHMMAAGLGPKGSMSANPTARDREFEFRLGQSEVVILADQEKQQARQNLLEGKAKVARLRDALHSAMADLERFATSYTQGGIK